MILPKYLAPWYSFYEYDPKYDTRTNSKYRKSGLGVLTGIMFIIGGMALVGLTYGDLDFGVYNNNKGTSADATLTWTENPIWPTYGKGAWVGLYAISVGILGVISNQEATYTSMKVYGISSLILGILTFYLTISTMILIEFGNEAKKSVVLPWAYYNTFAFNSAMAAISSALFVLTLFVGFTTLSLADLFSNNRYSPIKNNYRNN